MELRKILIEVDFVNKMVTADTEVETYANGAYAPRRNKKTNLDDELLTSFLSTAVDVFWHSDNDKLDFFQFFDNGQYFCQRQKRQYDFKTESSYYKTYSFTGATSEQARAFYEQLLTFFQVNNEIKNVEIEKKIGEIDKEAAFFEQRWYKIRRQKNEMLSMSDWRVLPDITEKYDGEKARWTAWRAWVREQSLVHPEDERFGGSGLAYFKYTYELLWPIDPSKYRKLYPNDMLEDGVTSAPAFMDENDANQWVKHDVEASTDFMKNREDSMFMLAQKHKLLNRKINAKMKDMMTLLKIDERIPEDWDRFYVYDAEISE